jgi:hypothetical protein
MDSINASVMMNCDDGHYILEITVVVRVMSLIVVAVMMILASP